MIDYTDTRQKFEFWADSQGYDITRNVHGDYSGLVEDSMWTGWQAREDRLTQETSKLKEDVYWTHREMG